MKTKMFFRTSITLFVSILILSSCTKEQDEPAPERVGKVSFEISQPANEGGRTSATQAIQSVVVSIEDASSNPILTNLPLSVNDFGDGYISEPINLPAGNYTLTAFGVEDDTQGIVYATPAEGSALAHLVTDPVPINFSISEDVVTQVIPEVISTAGFLPADFGYLTFKFTEVPIIYFQVGALVYDPLQQNYALTDAVLAVNGDNTPLHTRPLGDSTNVVVIQDGYTNYQLNISKPGYIPVDTVLTNAQLQSYTNTPLIVVLQSFPVPSSGTFTNSGQSLGSANELHVSMGDLDGDGDLDAFLANTNNQPNTVWLNDGSGTFTDSGQSLGSGDSHCVSVGDLDGDGDLDAFVANALDQPNTVWLNDGSGTFTDSGQTLGTLSSLGVSLGDLDGDGDLDAFVANVDSDPNKVWLNDGNGNFTDNNQNLGNSYSFYASLGDLDGDGDLDAYVANWFSQSNRVWLNDGSGNFTDSGNPIGGLHSRRLDLGDLDGDGDLDAFVVNGNNNPSQPNKVWFNDGNGNFSDSGQNLGSLDGYNVALGDVDGDGDLDAFVTNMDGPNRVWANDGSGNFTDSGQNLGSSDSRSVFLGDLNGDYILDAFVVNIGANTVWIGQP